MKNITDYNPLDTPVMSDLQIAASLKTLVDAILQCEKMIEDCSDEVVNALSGSAREHRIEERDTLLPIIKKDLATYEEALDKLLEIKEEKFAKQLAKSRMQNKSR